MLLMRIYIKLSDVNWIDFMNQLPGRPSYTI